MGFLIGKKEYMTQIFTEDGSAVPVTVLKAGPVFVTQVKSEDKDGYKAVQVGFGERRSRRVKKPQQGHARVALKSAGLDNEKTGFRIFREMPTDDDLKQEVGDKIDVSSFEIGDIVNVTGMSKGKGFQGGVKRHGFKGKNATHGTKHAHREIGSVGATGPQRIFKGRKMPGRMGYDRITTKNLEVVYVDKDNNTIALKGAVPGRAGAFIEIRKNK